jgi:hypothetical protein
MRLNDATPADWDRLRKDAPAIEKQATGLEAWMKAAHDEASDAWHEEEEDVVNNPDHYNTGNIECIDAIEESMSSVAFKGYLKGNCMKYLWRYDYKGKQVEDLQKAGWYLNKLTMMVVFENDGE